MANVKVTALKGFFHKGKEVAKDEEISLPPKIAASWAKIDKVKMSSETAAKVETVTKKK